MFRIPAYTESHILEFATNIITKTNFILHPQTPTLKITITYLENAREFKYTRHILKGLLPYSEKPSKPRAEPEEPCWLMTLKVPRDYCANSQQQPCPPLSFGGAAVFRDSLFSPHRLPKALPWSEGLHLWVKLVSQLLQAGSDRQSSLSTFTAFFLHTHPIKGPYCLPSPFLNRSL